MLSRALSKSGDPHVIIRSHGEPHPSRRPHPPAVINPPLTGAPKGLERRHLGRLCVSSINSDLLAGD